jgi:hypothetical protein
MEPRFTATVDTIPDLWPDSPKSGRLADASGRVPLNRLRVDRYDRLTPFLADMVFFTPALLYGAGFSDQHLLQCVIEVPGDIKFGEAVLPRPVFEGLEVGYDQKWNHTLWAVPRECWEPLRVSLCASMLNDPAEGRFGRIVHQKVPLDVPDPLWPSSPDRFKVEVFGVISNLWQLGIQGSPPRGVIGPPHPEMIAAVGAADLGVNIVDAQEAAQREHDVSGR